MSIEEKSEPNLQRGMKYSFLLSISLVFSKVVRGLLVPKILDPISYGLFSSIGLITRYIQFSDFGALASFIKEIPSKHFSSSGQERKNLIDETLSFLILATVFTSLYLGLVAIFFEGDNEYFFKTSALILIPTFALKKFKDFIQALVYGTGQYKNNALIAASNQWSGLICVVGGILIWGPLGGVMGLFLNEVLQLILVLRLVKESVRIKFSARVIQPIKKYSNLFFVQISETAVATFDQLLLIGFFGIRSFGFYSVAITFAWIFEAISEIINNAFYPQIMIAANKNISKGLNILQLGITCYFILVLAAIPPVIFLVSLLIKYYLTSYSVVLSIFIVVLVLGISRGLMALLKKGYIAADKERSFILLTSFSLVGVFLLVAIMIIFQLSLEGFITSLVIINVLQLLMFYSFLFSRKNDLFTTNLLIYISSSIGLIFFQIYQDWVITLTTLNVALIAVSYYSCLGVVIYLFRNVWSALVPSSFRTATE